MAMIDQQILEIVKRLKANSASKRDIEELESFIDRVMLLSTAVSDSGGRNFWEKNLFRYIHAITEISSAKEVDEIVLIAITHLTKLLGADLGFMLQRKSENLIGPWSSYVHRETKKTREILGLNWDDCYTIKSQFTDGNTHQFIISDIVDREEKQKFQSASIQSVLMIPLKFKGTLHGYALMITLNENKTFSPQQVAIGELLVDQAAISIEHAILLARSQNRTREIEAVYQASISLTTSLELPVVLNAILKSTMQLIKGANNSHIFLFENGQLSFGAALLKEGRLDKPISPPRENGITYTVARKAEIVVVEDFQKDEVFSNKTASWKGSIIALPLKIGENVVGVMSVAFNQPRKFPENETRPLKLMADQAAIAIENARLHRLIKQQANTDFLTDLPNRRAFDSRLETEIRRANRYLRPFTLAMIDLDHFKRINDTYGHQVGDAMLKKAAQIMGHSVRDTDFLCRYGGDEFAVILPETDRIAANEVIKRMQVDLENSILTLPDGSSGAITFCAGMVFSNPRMTATALVKKADDALYKVKKKKLGYS